MIKDDLKKKILDLKVIVKYMIMPHNAFLVPLPNP